MTIGPMMQISAEVTRAMNYQSAKASATITVILDQPGDTPEKAMSLFYPQLYAQLGQVAEEKVLALCGKPPSLPRPSASLPHFVGERPVAEDRSVGEALEALTAPLTTPMVARGFVPKPGVDCCEHCHDPFCGGECRRGRAA